MARGGPKLDHGRRQELGQSFQDGGEHYHRVRPGYPADSADWLIPAGARHCRRRGRRHRQVHGAAGGTRPAPSRRRPFAGHARPAPHRATRRWRRWRVPRRHTGLPADSAFDVVTRGAGMALVRSPAGQHRDRPDPPPRGVLGLIWNQLDTSVPWVHRLSRIMHAGDVHKPALPAPAGPGIRRDWKAT